MRLIVGLGNPGKRYEKTRHNVGFVALNRLRETLVDYGISPWELSKKFNAEIAGCTVNGEKIILAKPMTFMNDSGVAVALIANYYRIPPYNIIVAHDDKDIPLGTFKIQHDRGHAGHNGVRSVLGHLETFDIDRVRIGIAPRDGKKITDMGKFVLDKFGLLERRYIKDIIEHVVEQLLIMIKQTPQMNSSYANER